MCNISKLVRRFKDPLVAVHIPTKRVHTLPMGDFPSDVAFWSHGLALHRESLTLAVVNHAWKFGGERIEIFELAFESPEAPPTLRYVKSVVDPKLKYGQINSVALLSAAPLRFYATGALFSLTSPHLRLTDLSPTSLSLARARCLSSPSHLPLVPVSPRHPGMPPLIFLTCFSPQRGLGWTTMRRACQSFMSL